MGEDETCGNLCAVRHFLCRKQFRQYRERGFRFESPGGLAHGLELHDAGALEVVFVGTEPLRAGIPAAVDRGVRWAGLVWAHVAFLFLWGRSCPSREEGFGLRGHSGT